MSAPKGVNYALDKKKILYISHNFSLDITLALSFQINTKFVLTLKKKYIGQDTLQVET